MDAGKRGTSRKATNNIILSFDKPEKVYAVIAEFVLCPSTKGN